MRCASRRVVGDPDVGQKQPSLKLAGLVPISQLVGRDPVIEVSVAEFTATRAQSPSPLQARIRVPSRLFIKMKFITGIFFSRP